jgi:hypothetical protein
MRLAILGAILAFLVSGVSNTASSGDSSSDDVTRVAAEIDRLIEARWRLAGVTPSEPAEDATFLRRVSLHVGGCIPPVSVTHRFLDDSSPDKRRRMVDELLDGSGYVVNFTRYWRRTMLPETESDLQTRFLVPGFEAWLRDKLAANTSYDVLVREILNTPLESQDMRNFYVRSQGASPLAFYQAKQIAPENLAAATSRMFLGVRIECAQCHDHPFDKWKRAEFWSYAAFFAGIIRERQGDFIGRVREITDRREISIPDTDQVVQAAYLDGSEPQWRFKVGPRETLAGWITSRENPFFARAAANRLWGHFFGVGLVDPIDDFTAANPPSHPEILDLLANEFVSHDFDLKFLIRAITATKTYQLASRKTHESQSEPRLFARMSVQGLTPEQLYDSLAQATGMYQPFQPQNAFVLGNNPQGDFAETFADEGAAKTERETTILQALSLMNGAEITRATAIDGRSATPAPGVVYQPGTAAVAGGGHTLTALTSAPFLDRSAKIEALYLAALTRKPSPEELQRLTDYAASGGPKKDENQALADIFWALLNSSEFLMNH